MRLWSIHPKYLDPAGLTACWREGLLARKVLSGETEGYRSHPQLIRFRITPHPLQTIDHYLKTIAGEADRRGYHFNSSKISPDTSLIKLTVTQGQLQYEFEHLKHKLQKRHPQQYELLLQIGVIEPHPIFDIIRGKIENWEVIK